MIAPSPPPFIVGRARTAIHAPPEEHAAGFAENHALLIDNPFEPELLDAIRGAARACEWTDERIEGISRRQVEKVPRAAPAMRFALARPALYAWLGEATGCGPLTAVSGFVGQARANTHDVIEWHNDMARPRRRLAVIINLSDDGYEGGEFELRYSGSGRMVLRHRHMTPGSTLIFRVAMGLEHRVLPVISGGPRRVFAGWFYGPDAVRPMVSDCAGEAASPYPAP
jgi:hypothetical protein